MLKKAIVWGFFAAFAFGAGTNSFWLDLNSKDIEAGYERRDQLGSSSALHYGVDFLRAQDEFDDMNMLLGAHVTVVGYSPVPGLGFGLGFGGNFAWIDHGKSESNPVALPIKAAVYYTLPIAIHTTLSASYAIAPSSLCLVDCDRYNEFRLEASIEPMEGGMVVAGWRDIEYREDGNKYEFNQSFYVGVRISF
ncbi:hypothetical protein AGMMS50229_02560 [Campylobacterota bacterium]|nr:hypothetical protein AGMMS50229_02560 [Campylobacterota bacterium]